MKKNIFIVSILLSVNVWACDEALKAFPKDCKIQDKFWSVRAKFKKQQEDVNEIAEYRLLRFFDINSVMNAESNNIAPKNIYKPAPQTWDVWDGGIRTLFSGPLKGILFTKVKFDNITLAYINKTLLVKDGISIKDTITDPNKMPGEFRINNDQPVGYCSNNVNSDTAQIQAAQASIAKFQATWEKQNGITFKEMVRQMGGVEPELATMNIKMGYSGLQCNGGYPFIGYAPTADVMRNLSWMQAFINFNLNQYKLGKATISPVQLAALVQKWFVTIHPFADGNGRTSRAIQDYILSNFDLPFAPGGVLQNDALATVEDYTNLNYTALDDVLNNLDSCVTSVNYLTGEEDIPYNCAPVSMLNEL